VLKELLLTGFTIRSRGREMSGEHLKSDVRGRFRWVRLQDLLVNHLLLLGLRLSKFEVCLHLLPSLFSSNGHL
jgi:hypothetical protein